MKKIVLMLTALLSLSFIIVMATDTLGIRKSIENMRKAYEIDTDSLFTHLDKIEKSAIASKNPVEKGIYYSILASLYQQYHDENRYFIDDRTDIDGPAPEDVREWTKKNFNDKVRECLNKSLENRDDLLAAQVTDYRNEIEINVDYKLRPTVYDVLVHRAINMLESDTAQVFAYYNDLLEAHKNDPVPHDAAKLDLHMYKYKKLEKGVKFGNGFAEEYKDTPLYVYAMALELNHCLRTDKEKHDICLEFEKKYPDNPYISSIIRIREDIEECYIAFDNYDSPNHSDLFYPGKDENVKITYKGTKHIKVIIKRLKLSHAEYLEKRYKLSPSDWSVVSEKEYDLEQDPEFKRRNFSITINENKCGIYKFIIIPDDKEKLTISHNFTVTKFMAFPKILKKGAEFYVVDRISGEPLKGVTVRSAKSDVSSFTAKTNEFGVATVKKEKDTNMSVFVEDGSDTYYPVCHANVYGNDDKLTRHAHVSFFLDRAVYRPGQTVRAKGICYESYGDEYKLFSRNTPVEVSLYDANWSKVESQKVQTNEYGSFYVEFKIPEGLLNGNFHLNSFAGSQTFKVEEYKRPTFEVSVDNVAATVITDTVKVKGVAKYYRGTPVSGGTVKYNVVSTPVYYCYWGWNLPQLKSVVASGTAECDENGNYNFEFLPNIVSENDHPFYRFNIEVDVTDVSNETQSGSYSFVIGRSSYSLNLPLNGLTDKDKLGDIIPSAYDRTGNKVTIKGVYQLKKPGDVLVKEGKFTSWKKLDIDFKKLESGKYYLYLEATDDKERKVSSYSDFTLYSLSDGKPAVESLQWVIPVKTKCADGETAEILLGSSYNAYTLMDVYSGDELIERKVLKLKSGNIKLKFEFKKSYQDRLSVQFVTVREGKSERRSVTIERVVKSRDLKIEYTHINKVYEPNEKDKWTACITDVDGNPVTVEALVCMYDISLDAIASNSWYFNPVHKTYPTPPVWSDNSSGFLTGSTYYHGSYHSMYSFSYPELKMFGFNLWSSRYYAMGGRSLRGKGAGRGLRLMEDGGEVRMLEKNAVMATAEVEMEEASVEMADAALPQAADMNDTDDNIAVRGNFAETAFFYPQLMAGNGALEFEFEAPEALTGWKVMTLVHSNDIRTAVLTDTVKTQKTISVNTNLPRFVRTTDSVTLAATIENLSDEAKDVTTKWTVSDMVSGDVLAEFSEVVKAGASSNCSTTCKVSVPKTASLLKVRVTAKSGRFTDGVENLIPVLSSQTIVTESMPISIFKPGDYEFEFESYANNKSETLVSRSFTIDITPDAATMALQSLPYIKEPYYEDAVDIALAYYVNWLSSAAVAKNKNLKAYLERLKSGEQTVESPLSANESLKNILLQESPWVLDAKFETERNNSLVELLNVKAQESKREKFLKRLFKLQNGDGGFAWFEGGKSSWYITHFVVEQLQKTGYSSDEYKKAVKYLVVEMERSYQEQMKLTKVSIPGTYDISTMLIAGKQSTPSYKHYYKYIYKNWKKYTLPQKALIARVLFADGDPNEAKRIINHIREFYVFKPNLGLYWPNTSNIYTQADYIEAFATVDPNEEELAKMKLWLLYNKQTNMWGNSVATADALGALVFAGNSVGNGDGRLIVNIGDVTLDSDSVQWAASMRECFDGKALTPELAKIKAHKTGTTLALGAAYWQYTEDVDKVLKHTDDRLKLEKTYYVQKDGMLKPVSLTDDIHTADKVIVRLVVTADRSMQFIHLRDLRPAGLEPASQVSGYRIMSGLMYYTCTKDYSVDFFFDYMPKGTYVFEYELKANLAGDYAAGFATIESMYSADFKSQTKGLRMRIN